MKLPVTLNNDKNALGLLTGVIGLVLIVSWLLQGGEKGPGAYQAQQSSPDPEKTVPSNGVRAPRAFRGKREMDWIVKVDYMAHTGSIEVDLRHRGIPIDDRLKVHANFKAARSQSTTASRWLSRQANGVYRAGDLRLDPGKWTMGLTGYRLSKLTFRIEQILEVK